MQQTITHGTVQVFTFKQGLLSAVAHDLRLRCERFEVALDAGRIRASFDPSSFRVEGAMHKGRLEEGALSADQRREIFETVQHEILHTARYPEIVFEGELTEQKTRLKLDGELALRGVRRPIQILGERTAAGARGEVELVPSRWGIAPYAALLGAIRLQDRVVVRFDLQA
jgi:hypothetical protein